MGVADAGDAFWNVAQLSDGGKLADGVVDVAEKNADATEARWVDDRRL